MGWFFLRWRDPRKLAGMGEGVLDVLWRSLAFISTIIIMSPIIREGLKGECSFWPEVFRSFWPTKTPSPGPKMALKIC